jgi:DNA polymerase-4
MDAFFAAIEEKDNPSLKGKAVIVGGIEERGVVCTCSYEARKFGVHSAMPTYIAKQKCPFGIFVPVRYDRYKDVSSEIFNILYSITDLVEPLSIDEAYLDISNIEGDPLNIAKGIKKKVKEETGLTISVGISYNKFLAKLASDWNKPDGIKIIEENEVPEILLPLAIRKIYGIGEKSTKKLNGIGIYTVEDLMKIPVELFGSYFGKYGYEIYNRIRGIDNREVKISRKVKSIGRETTLKRDINDVEKIQGYIEKFSKNIAYSLEKRNLAAKTLTIKTRTSDFISHTKSKTMGEYFYTAEDIIIIGGQVLKEIDLDLDIRLIGISVSNLKERFLEQMSIF